MKILYCCPECRCEDLEFISQAYGNIKCLNNYCNNIFHISKAGYIVKKYRSDEIRCKGKKKSSYKED